MPEPLRKPDHENGGASVTPLLRTHGLTFAVRGRRLVDGVDLAIDGRRRTVLMGANGAGKSLLLRLLHGLLQPSSGEIFWKDRPLDAAARRAQTMVFQRPVLLRRSVRANLRFVLSVRGVANGERSRREDEALERAGLKNLARHPARLLSGGEQQRLAIARALACDPDMLFLDEPTASLDPASTHAIERQIREAHDRGIAILLVTHDAGQARRLGEHAIFMAGGRIVETGSAGDLLDRPRSAAARAWRDGRLHFPGNHDEAETSGARP